MEVGSQRQAPAVLLPLQSPCTSCTGGWVGRRHDLDACGLKKISFVIGVRTPSRPAERIGRLAALSRPFLRIMGIINELREQNAELLNIIARGAYADRCTRWH